MKIKSMALAITAFLAVSIFVLGGKSFAVGGAGTQSTATTITALTDVKASATVADVDTAVQDFLNQYSINFSTTQVSDSSITANGLTDSDVNNAKNFGVELIEEWSKYTTTWVADSGLQTIYGVNSLKVGPPSPSQVRCASFNNPAKYMIYDVSCSGVDSIMRHDIHHEYAHYLEFNKFGAFAFDTATWNSYNTLGFSYGSGGASAYGNSGFVNYEHPQDGFVSAYSTSAIEEDQAEVYAYLFTTSDYQKLAGWIPGDSNLNNKVSRYKAFILSVDPTMDDTYFSAIHTYATANNTTIYPPYTGPGYQTVLPDGSGTIYTVYPANVDTTAGIAVGVVGDPNTKQILVLDGKIRGGFASFVEVLDGGTLMGTGLAEKGITVDSGGILAPGHSPGCMSSGDLIINGTYQAEIGGPVACSEYDQVKVTGTVDITGGTLDTILYNGYKPKAGEKYTIIDNDSNDAVTGTFSGLAEGATFNISGNVFKITYTGGDGNDVVLSVVSVPTTPNTGFALITASPVLTLLGTILASGGIFGIAQRSRRLPVRARR